MIGVATWHEGRCGSSVLGSLLNQHSQIQAANEIFSRYMPRRWGDKPVPAIPDVLHQAMATASKPVLQIEIKSLRAQNRSLYPGLTLEDWLDQLFAHGFQRQVILHRRNGLRRLVSHLMAQPGARLMLPATKSTTAPRCAITGASNASKFASIQACPFAAPSATSTKSGFAALILA